MSQADPSERDAIDIVLNPNNLTAFPRNDAKRAKDAASALVEQRRRLHELSARHAFDRPNALEHAEELIEQADRVLLHAVALERARGRSWHMIGTALGISRQAAHERFAQRLAAILPAWRALADQGRGDGEDVQSIDEAIEGREQIVAPDRD